ncbi:amine sulfotransferase-like isoform X1 [Hoplias malabaricus]|uniref:amine sulfotransferase-like isoform X1 n=1 Tax=Hoplias malabaricus TaxID=27720 RepID=UPI0034631162
MEKLNEYLSKYKGFVFPTYILLVEHIDSLQNFEIRDSDVFLVTYGRSGTIWTQNIIMSICDSECTDETEFPNNMKKMPWLEYPPGNMDYSTRASPRFFTSHLNTALMPPGLREKKPKCGPSWKHPGASRSFCRSSLLEMWEVLHGLITFETGTHTEMTSTSCSSRTKTWSRI